jgi:tetratricopeptide (TPR) repeat protein
MPWSAPPLPMVSLVMLLMAGASTASAQRRGPPTATSTSTQDPAPESAPATDPEVERLARELFEQGRDAYANGQFAEARDLFQHSYDLSGRPGLLYNIAQASERMRDDQHALDVYRAYLEAVPDASERDFVEARIVFLQERVRAQAETTTEEPRGLDLGPLPVALVAGGSGLAAAGGLLLGLGIRGRNQVEDAPDGSDYEGVRGGGQRARGLGYAGQIALGVGVAAAVTGVILVVLSDPEDPDGSARRGPNERQLALRIGLGDLTLMGSF